MGPLSLSGILTRSCLALAFAIGVSSSPAQTVPKPQSGDELPVPDGPFLPPTRNFPSTILNGFSPSSRKRKWNFCSEQRSTMMPAPLR